MASSEVSATAAVDPYANGSLLYHQTIIPTQGISHTVKGSFTLPGSQDLILVRHNTLELWTLHLSQEGGARTRAECIHSCPLFANVLATAAVSTGLGGGGGHDGNAKGGEGRSRAGASPISALFAAGGGYDYVLLTSETGYATLLRYELAEPPVPTRTSFLTDHTPGTKAMEGGGGAEGTSTYVAPSLRGHFVKVGEVCLGRSGARLTVPGVRVSVDPRGEAILITALMRNKVVIPVRRTQFGVATTAAHSATSSSGVSASATSLGWLGAGGSQNVGGNSSDDDEDNEEGTGSGGLLRGAGSADDGFAAGRQQLARKKRRRLAPRGVIALGSPIEAHRQTIIHSSCALEGFVDMSIFAVLEQDTVEVAAASEGEASAPATTTAAHKYLVIYAYQPSLQQVQRTHLVRLPPSAHRLVPVPAVPYGPGGVIVCMDAELVWYDLSAAAFASNTGSAPSTSSGSTSPAGGGVFKCAAPLPRRMAYTETLYDAGIIAHTTTCVRRDFFMLLQDEQGDLLRVFLSRLDVQKAYDALKAAEAIHNNPNLDAKTKKALAPHVANPLSVHYFDTIPTVTDMALFPKGVLFAATESGPTHGLYKIIRDGYTKDADYIVKRVRRVFELPPLPSEAIANGKSGEGTAAAAAAAPLQFADAKRPREANEQGDVIVKKEEGSHSSSEGKPKVLGKLLTKLPPLVPPPQQPAAAPRTAHRVIAIYQPHRGLRHMALVQSYPNTPPIVSFTSAIPSASHEAGCGGGDGNGSAGPPPVPPGAGLLGDAGADSAAEALAAAASAQPQMQFNLVAGRGAGSVLLSARFGYATRREGHFQLPCFVEAVISLLSASGLQQLVVELEDAVAQAQVLNDAAAAAAAVLGDAQPTHSAAVATAAASSPAVRLRTLHKLLATSSHRETQLWTDTLLFTTSQGTTVAYHIGRTMAPDTWTGFITAERTLAAATLKYGIGYVQITPRGIHVLPPVPRPNREASGQPRIADDEEEASKQAEGGSGLVQPAHWAHRHGKTILAAAATPTTLLVTFAQGGGIASFDFGLTGMQLEQCDDLPTFPPSPAVSLLQPSPESLTGSAMNAQLNVFLSGGNNNRRSSGGSSSATEKQQRHTLAAAGLGSGEERELAAIATVAQEVYIVNPKKLREPLGKISCKPVAHAHDDGSGSHSNNNSNDNAIVSVLLTYLGGNSHFSSSSLAKQSSGTGSSNNNGTAQQQLLRSRRLFCFIGHLNGRLTRCELDPVTAKVIERDELTCGTAPCHLVAGDGQSVCYVHCGALHAWRCEVRDGVAKVVPWRFPTRQGAFASFLRPQAALAAAAAAAASAGTTAAGAAKKVSAQKEPRVKQENEDEEGADNNQNPNDDEDEDEEGSEEQVAMRFIAAAGSGAGGGGVGGSGGSSLLARDECVVAVLGNELSLFSAQKAGSGASSLEYSFTAHTLPVAGRRILQHTTRSNYFAVLSTEHRGYCMSDIKKMREQQQEEFLANPGGLPPSGPIPLDAPQRALGWANTYSSTLQLFNEESNRVLPRYFFPEGEAVLCGTLGSFTEDFGKEPVIVVGVASQYTHGAGCGSGARWSQGWLYAFRFTTQPVKGPGGGDGPAAGSRIEPVLRVEHLHRTLIRSDTDATTGLAYGPDYPSAVHVCEDVGLLFVGLGAEHGLRIYVWGQQQFLRKRHLANVPSRIVAITTAWVAPPPGSATTNVSANFLSDLYHVPFSNPEALKRAREQRLLVYCATANHSVFVASLQSGAGTSNSGAAAAAAAGSASFLLVVARDAILRSLTASSLVVLGDGRTVCVADRHGTVAFLRMPLTNRNEFSLPIADMRDAAIAQAEVYISQEQYLEEVASHATGQVVTALRAQRYDPSNGTNPSLAVELVVYSTALGAVGAYVPFVNEEDAALAAYVQPMLSSRMRTLLAPGDGALPASIRGRLIASAGTAPAHHVVEGDILHVYRQATGAASSLFSTAAKVAVEEELTRARRMEAARRRALGLPARELPNLVDLIAKQRALASLPQ